MPAKPTVLDRVREALGRTAPLDAPPVPPPLPDPIVRLVHTDFGLPDLFATRAAEMKMGITKLRVEQLHDELVGFLRGKNVRRVCCSGGGLLDKLDVLPALRRAGFDATSWDQITLDEMYDYDCAVTDATYAVAETGSLVILPTGRHGRALTLTPFVHVAVVEPKNCIPDLLDLFERLQKDDYRGNVIMITGPSKTADIEMNVVVGVHGPNVVQTFLLT